MGEPAAYRNAPPPEGELAKRLENMGEVRSRILISPGYLTQWLNSKAINVKSAKALGLNARVLEVVAEWWCPNFEYIKILTIDVARTEASSGTYIQVFTFPILCRYSTGYFMALLRWGSTVMKFGVTSC